MPCCNHSHRETRKSVWMCAESTATVIVRGGHRGTIRHASSHTEQRPKPAVQKQRGEEKRMTPRAGNTFTHGGHRAAALPFQHGMQANVPPSPRAFMQSGVQIPIFCVLEKQEKGENRRKANQHGKRHSWMAAINTVRPQQSRTVAAHNIHKNKKEKKRKTRRQGVAVCVALRVSARPDRKKQNKRERNVCSVPQALVARPHVTAPSARRSSRPLLMRAAGEAHRAVVMSVSVGVRVERLGGNTRHPSQEECRRNN
ncbi:hypothetical protein TCDM_10710 [Trypanosoma cruzi Dm28c]|uniref:Uncharacterized protein n=1 Tax=Trypanosoma cruzi Dm28c TaxID=1416333 RepID=V5ALV0_TRYCR|nr:hypothetical protein TCDM_10710 [Trypanosoma cruzi Dm28c]